VLDILARSRSSVGDSGVRAVDGEPADRLRGWAQVEAPAHASTAVDASDAASFGVVAVRQVTHARGLIAAMCNSYLMRYAGFRAHIEKGSGAARPTVSVVLHAVATAGTTAHL